MIQFKGQEACDILDMIRDNIKRNYIKYDEDLFEFIFDDKIRSLIDNINNKVQWEILTPVFENNQIVSILININLDNVHLKLFEIWPFESEFISIQIYDDEFININPDITQYIDYGALDDNNLIGILNHILVVDSEDIYQLKHIAGKNH